MFGYINVNEKNITKEDKEIYHSYYCGLCHSLKMNYDHYVTKFHSYDMTFLLMILSSLYEPSIQKDYKNCLLHPIKKHSVRMNDYNDYVSDMSIILAYYKAKDDVLDENKHHQRFKKLSKHFNSIKDKYKNKITIIDESLNKIKELEDENFLSIDIMANTFGNVLGEIFAYSDDIWKDDLYTLGNNLGKFIYVMDAYDDIVEDVKYNRYNPFINIYKNNDFNNYVENILTLYISEATLAFERLPLLKYDNILKNILYSGVWSKFESLKERDYESL